MTRQDWLPSTFTQHSEKDIPIDYCAFGLLVQSFSVNNELFTRQCAQ